MELVARMLSANMVRNSKHIVHVTYSQTRFIFLFILPVLDTLFFVKKPASESPETVIAGLTLLPLKLLFEKGSVKISACILSYCQVIQPAKMMTGMATSGLAPSPTLKRSGLVFAL